LLGHGLIFEQSEASREVIYDFTHDRLRALVYEETSQARRCLLHRRVAESLAGRLRGRREVGAVSGLAAHHFQLAGEDTQAAEYFKLAGEHACSLYANVEAIAHFQAALASGYPQAAVLREAIGDLQILSGDYRAAIDSYEAAAALCTQGCQAGLEAKLGDVRARRGEWGLAEAHFQAALQETEDSGLRARIFAEWSRTVHQQNQHDRAGELAYQALHLAEQARNARALAQAHNMLGILARAQGDFDLAAGHLAQSLQIAEQLDDPAAQIAALNNLAQVYGDRKELRQAIDLTHSALELCTRQGDRHREAALLNNLADLHHAAGETDLSIEYLKKAVVIFAEIGVKADDAQSEIWKLYEW
jgi:tetratricopeptide (TPR) repeat protein